MMMPTARVRQGYSALMTITASTRRTLGDLGGDEGQSGGRGHACEGGREHPSAVIAGSAKVAEEVKK
jgi:hypothetical protein